MEDEPHLAFSLELNLINEGYHVTIANNGVQALTQLAESGPFDLILLDIMLPEINGFEVARKIRTTDKQTGILMLTARASDEDIVEGLQTGADDYLTKPFKLQELLLRIRRMIKRSEFFTPDSTDSNQTILQNGKITLNMDSLQLKSSRGIFNLTILEADVLKEFLQNPEKILTRDYLLTKVWDINGNVETRTVDNFIMRLRKYIEIDSSKPKILVSVRGKGYRLTNQIQNWENKIGTEI